jgi:hypothetical protein
MVVVGMSAVAARAAEAELAAEADLAVVRPRLAAARTRLERIVNVAERDRILQRDTTYPICRLVPESSWRLFTEKSLETMSGR